MYVSEFRQTLDELTATNSRTEKKEIIRNVSDSPAAISFLSGSEYDDAGLGKKTVLECAKVLYDTDGTPTVSESLEEYEPSPDTGKSSDLSELRDSMDRLANKSGNNQKDTLKQMFGAYNYPSVVAHACLDDLATGVSDTTIANALDLRDSLPFYSSVVEAASAPNPVEQPVIHNAFSPMLAKSESSLPDDLSGYISQPKLDGYRLIISIGSKRVTAFTRRGNEVSESLPELNEIHWPDGEHIIDCEVIAADGTYKSTSERIGRDAENVERNVDMEFGVFDILTFKDEPVHDEPYYKRHGYASTFSSLTDDSRVGTLPIFTDEEEAKAVASDYEGLIWKELDAPYEFGKRSSSWVKEKHTAETADLVAVRFVEGEGRLDGTLGKIALATADGHSVGHTGSGLTDEQRDEIWANQEEYLGETVEVEAEAFDSGLRFPIFQRWRTDDGEPDSLERVEEVMPEA